jgi:hypothetical protein
MNAKWKVTVLLAIFAAVVVAVFASKALFAPGPEITAAEGPANLPLGSAPLAPTPGPTRTPVSAPEAAVLITADEARERGLRWSERHTPQAAVGPAAEPAVVSVDLGTAGDGRGGDGRGLGGYDNDYPVWRVSATGTFISGFGMAGAEIREYNKITFRVDAVDGSIMGFGLTDPITE